MECSVLKEKTERTTQAASHVYLQNTDEETCGEGRLSLKTKVHERLRLCNGFVLFRPRVCVCVCVSAE